MSEKSFHRNQRFVELLAAVIILANFAADVEFETPVGTVSVTGSGALSSDWMLITLIIIGLIFLGGILAISAMVKEG